MRIVIGEDQVLLRDGMVRLLAAGGHQVVAAVGDAAALIEAVNTHRPSLVVTDIRMPPTQTDDGARAAAYLRSRFPELAVVLLSQHTEPEFVAAVAGQRPERFGYLLKDGVLDTRRFLAQLADVAAGGTAIDPAIVASYVKRDAPALARAELTEREIAVHARVASGRSNAGIAADLVISRRTVDAHLRSIFAKLGLSADPDGNQRVLAVLHWFGRASAAP